MKLLAKITPDEFDGLQDNLKENYLRIEPDGSDPHYALEVEGLTDSLKTALQRERSNVKKTNAKVNDLASKLSEAEAQIESLSSSAASSEELTTLQKRNKQLTATLESLAKKQAVAEAIEANKAVSGLGPIFVDDKVQVEITGDGVRAFIEHDGQEMTVNDFVGELYHATDQPDHPLFDPELPRQFRNRVKSGGGTTPNVGSQQKTGFDDKPPRRSKMTTREKVAFIKEHGEEAFTNLQL